MRSCPLPPMEADDEPSNPDQAANENNQGSTSVAPDTSVKVVKEKGKGKTIAQGSASAAPDTSVKAVKKKGKGKKMLKGPLLLLHLIQAVKEKGKGKKKCSGVHFAAAPDISVKAKQKKTTTGNASKSISDPSTTSFRQQTIVPPIPDFAQKFTVAQLLARMMATNNVYVDIVRTNLDAQSTQFEVTLDDPLAVAVTQNSQVDPKNGDVGGQNYACKLNHFLELIEKLFWFQVSFGYSCNCWCKLKTPFMVSWFFWN
ncbi:choice-of-anchor D domain [Sesbania bispinosa]|nr:choice-of-anchor D domain [Sesbania bispinosa]